MAKSYHSSTLPIVPAERMRFRLAGCMAVLEEAGQERIIAARRERCQSAGERAADLALHRREGRLRGERRRALQGAIDEVDGGNEVIDDAGLMERGDIDRLARQRPAAQ